MVNSKDVVESNSAVVAPIRLIFLSILTAQILMSHKKDGANYVVLKSGKILILNNDRQK